MERMNDFRNKLNCSPLLQTPTQSNTRENSDAMTLMQHLYALSYEGRQLRVAADGHKGLINAVTRLDIWQVRSTGKSVKDDMANQSSLCELVLSRLDEMQRETEAFTQTVSDTVRSASKADNLEDLQLRGCTHR